MAALLIAWGVFILAIIARAILDTRPPIATLREQAPDENQAAAEECAQTMEAIALSVF
jgi:hypothetical protein